MSRVVNVSQGKLGVPGLPGYPGRQGPKVTYYTLTTIGDVFLTKSALAPCHEK